MSEVSSEGMEKYQRIPGWEHPWPDINMPDDRRLQFFSNTSSQDEGTLTSGITHHMLYESMTRQGLTIMPEIEARDSSGDVMDQSVAVYVDSRIGTHRIFTMIDHVLSSEVLVVATSSYRPKDVDLLVAQGIEELGLRDVIAECRQGRVAHEIGKTATDQQQTYNTGL